MENNLTNAFKDLLPQQEDGSQELLYLFEQIMRLPDTLEQKNVDSIINLINQNFTEKIREESVKNIIKNFEEEKMTRREVINQIEKEKRIIQEVIDENLTPSPIKRQLLDRIFEIFYDIFDRAIDRYHNYSIQLPIKLDEGAQMPTYAHETDACADIYASTDFVVKAHSFSNMIPTGIHMELPEGWVAKIVPRSSIGAKTLLRLSNSVGVIDSKQVIYQWVA